MALEEENGGYKRAGCVESSRVIRKFPREHIFLVIVSDDTIKYLTEAGIASRQFVTGWGEGDSEGLFL
ncbi:MAG: hypothetical protein CMO55_00120 [Verrucomicrobiales bacterium]|nr:hypothetical protein [Verrucomicrobiales bacterium]